MEASFPDGKPLRINREDFRRQFLASFPKLTGFDGNNEADSIIDGAIDAVYDMFTGVATLWDKQPAQTWYIADMYPKYVAGVTVMGAVPLKEKKIGGVDLKFDTDYLTAGKGSNLLSGLLTNPFGKSAYMMITCCAKRIALR